MLLLRLWIAIAGTALIFGGVASLLKLWVIVATDGRVVATGAAGIFFDLGLYLLLVGSTGVGLRLAKTTNPQCAASWRWLLLSRLSSRSLCSRASGTQS
jgi:hypothetical protein